MWCKRDVDVDRRHRIDVEDSTRPGEGSFHSSLEGLSTDTERRGELAPGSSSNHNVDD
jgi:hypothetical protein